MSQTSYAIDQSVAKEGMEADSRLVSDIGSKCNTAGAALFGHYMALGADENKCVAPSTAAEITSLLARGGVVVASHNLEQPFPAGSATPQYPADSAVPLMKKGAIWVRVEEAVDHTADGVFVRFAAGASLTTLGAFGQDDGDEGGGALRAALANARWLTSAGAGELAKLELDL